MTHKDLCQSLNLDTCSRVQLIAYPTAPKCHNFLVPETTLHLVSTKNHDLWEETSEVCDSGTSLKVAEHSFRACFC